MASMGKSPKTWKKSGHVEGGYDAGKGQAYYGSGSPQDNPTLPKHKQEPLERPVGQMRRAPRRSRVVPADEMRVNPESNWQRVQKGAKKVYKRGIEGADKFWEGVGSVSSGFGEISRRLPGSDFSDILPPPASNDFGWSNVQWGFGFDAPRPRRRASDGVPDREQYRSNRRITVHIHEGKSDRDRPKKPKKQKLPDFGFKTRW